MSDSGQSSSSASAELSGQLALITGATGGIGRATCHALARMGCDVAVHYHSSSPAAEALAAELRSSYRVGAQVFQADLSSYDETRRLHSEVVSSMGQAPTVLFNNAGVTLGKYGAKDISDISIEDFEKTWRANCATGFLLTQLCIPAMVERGHGRVVFCSSYAAFMGGQVGPHYASSKSALHGLIHWLASTYASRGITINGVAPSLISETKMMPGDAETTKFLASKVPVGRLGKPEEVADTVAWMVKTGYVTNKVIGVDGGMLVQ